MITHNSSKLFFGFAMAACILLCACDNGSHTVAVDVPTLAECQANGWVHNKNSLGVCDSLLFQAFVDDCEWDSTVWDITFNMDPAYGGMSWSRKYWKGAPNEFGIYHFENLVKMSELISTIYWAQYLYIERSPRLKTLPAEVWQTPFFGVAISFNDSLDSLYDGGSCQGLEVLYMTNNPKLRNLPSVLGTCHSLQKLTSRGSAIRRLPNWLVDLPQLNYLAFDKDSLDSLPEWLPKLDSVYFINVSDNQISVLPANIVNMPSLENIWFANNVVVSLPSTICQAQFKAILSGNKICDLPDSIKTCTGWVEATAEQICQ